jgi:hypothetical protein
MSFFLLQVLRKRLALFVLEQVFQQLVASIAFGKVLAVRLAQSTYARVAVFTVDLTASVSVSIVQTPFSFHRYLLMSVDLWARDIQPKQAVSYQLSAKSRSLARYGGLVMTTIV